MCAAVNHERVWLFILSRIHILYSYDEGRCNLFGLFGILSCLLIFIWAVGPWNDTLHVVKTRKNQHGFQRTFLKGWTNNNDHNNVVLSGTSAGVFFSCRWIYFTTPEKMPIKTSCASVSICKYHDCTVIIPPTVMWCNGSVQKYTCY